MLKNSVIIFVAIIIALAGIFPNNLKADDKIWDAYLGFAYGPEQLLAFPKICVQYPTDLLAVDKNSGVYFGASASIWFFFFPMYSLGIETGYHHNIIGLGASLTLAGLPNTEPNEFEESVQKLTFNPKISFRFKYLYIRIGPSLTIKEYIADSDKNNFDKQGVFGFFRQKTSITHFNIDLMFRLPIEKMK